MPNGRLWRVKPDNIAIFRLNLDIFFANTDVNTWQKKRNCTELTAKTSDDDGWQNEYNIRKSMLEWIIFSTQFNHFCWLFRSEFAIEIDHDWLLLMMGYFTHHFAEPNEPICQRNKKNTVVLHDVSISFTTYYTVYKYNQTIGRFFRNEQNSKLKNKNYHQFVAEDERSEPKKKREENNLKTHQMRTSTGPIHQQSSEVLIYLLLTRWNFHR